MLYPDIGVGPSIPLLSSTPIKRPNKRSRLELEEDPSGASSSMNVEEPMDSTYDPADSVTTLTEPTDVKWQGYLFVNVAISSVVLIFYYVMWNLEIIEVTLYYSNRFESSKPGSQDSNLHCLWKLPATALWAVPCVSTCYQCTENSIWHIPLCGTTLPTLPTFYSIFWLLQKME